MWGNFFPLLSRPDTPVLGRFGLSKMVGVKRTIDDLTGKQGTVDSLDPVLCALCTDVVNRLD